MTKAALLIGINYLSDPMNRLNGCCNDVINMAHLLKTKYGFLDNKVKVTTDALDPNSTTRDAIVKSLHEFAQQSWDDHIDVAYFHYSGHGSQQWDTSGEEKDLKDEGICPSDFCRTGLIIDDELLKIFSSFNPKTTVLAVFDCCHSESILDLPFEYPSTKPLYAVKKQMPKVVMLSGCIDSSTSDDAYDATTKKFGGALTMCLMKALQDNKSTKLVDIYQRVLTYLKEGRYVQHPVMSSSFIITPDLKLF